MVDIAERICTPEQAKFFAQSGLVQVAQYAWEKDGSDYVLTFYPDKRSGLPLVVDWHDDKETYAAFDNTDLGLMLASIGFYPAGPSYQVPGESAQYKWWCDDINTFSSVEDMLYQAYGKTEAQAKAAMLKKLIDSKKVPLLWHYFTKQKLTENRNLGQAFGDRNHLNNLDMNDLPPGVF